MSESARVLHVTTTEDWATAQSSGAIRTPSLVTEGFIHCCTPAQLTGVLERFYAGRTDLVVLELDAASLADDLAWESPAPPEGSPVTDAEAGQSFPHVYAEIPLDRVLGPYPGE